MGALKNKKYYKNNNEIRILKQSTSYQDEDVSLTLLMKVVGKLRQLTELDFVISEIFFILHVVDVSVLNVLQGKKRQNVYCMST